MADERMRLIMSQKENTTKKNMYSRLNSCSRNVHTKTSFVLTAFFLGSLALLSVLFSEQRHKEQEILMNKRFLDEQNTDYSDYSCNEMYQHTSEKEQQCLFAKTCNGGDGVFAPFVFCRSWSPTTYFWILSPFLLLWLITLFRMLGSTAEYFFSPSLEMFSVKLGLPPRFAGVSLLALGNGAADVSATVNAITADPQNGYKFSLGALTGAAMFIGAVISGSVIIVADGVPCRGALVRDATTLFLTVVVVAWKLYSGVIGPSAVSLFVTMYLCFVMVVLIADVYHRAVVLPRIARAREMEERRRQLQQGQMATSAAGDALNDLAIETTEIESGREHNNLASRAIDSVLVALSNYGTTPDANNIDGWGVESQDLMHENPVVLHGNRGLLHQDEHHHANDTEDSIPYTAMMESTVGNACAEPGSFSASNWKGAFYDAKQELHVHFRNVWLDIFDEEENSVVDKILMVCELPFTVARQITVPVPVEGQYCRALVALSVVLSPIWFGLYLWMGHDTNLFWQDGMSYIGIAVVVAAVVGALIVRYAPGGDGVMTLLVSTPIALYGFCIAATWIDFVADKLVTLLDFLGIIGHVPAPIMGLTVLAWGNSMGDLSANLTMARKGLANMAMTACFAGPVFNILIGLAMGFTSLATTTGNAEKEVTVTPAVLIGISFIILNCGLMLVTGVCLSGGGTIPKRYGYVSVGLYSIYVVTSVIMEFYAK